MRSKKRKGSRVKLDDVSVNITPLLDVLTVLLFFLIKSFTVNSLTLEAAKGIRLPASISDLQAEEAIQLVMGDESIRSGGEVILKLKNKRFDAKDIESDGRTLKPLKEFLEAKLDKKYKFYGENYDLSKLPPNKILIQADKELPFGKVKYLLHTLAVSGYMDYQFVIIPDEE